MTVTLICFGHIVPWTNGPLSTIMMIVTLPYSKQLQTVNSYFDIDFCLGLFNSQWPQILFTKALWIFLLLHIITSPLYSHAYFTVSDPNCIMLSSSTSGRFYSGHCPTQNCNATVIFTDTSKEASCFTCKSNFPTSSLINDSKICGSGEALCAILQMLYDYPSKPDPPVVRLYEAGAAFNLYQAYNKSMRHVCVLSMDFSVTSLCS